MSTASLKAKLGRTKKSLSAVTKRRAKLLREIVSLKKRIRARISLRMRAADEAIKLVGVTEAGGNNRGAMVDKIIRYAKGDLGEAWCVDFVIWAYGHAGSKAIRPGFTRAVRYMQTPGVVRVQAPRRGHIVRYTFDHTGLFLRWRKDLGSGYFEAVEGNTGNSGATSDSVTGGDGVKVKVRHTSLVRDFLRATS